MVWAIAEASAVKKRVSKRPRAARGRNGAGDEVNLTEIGVHIGFGKLGPDLAGRVRRTITFHAEQ